MADNNEETNKSKFEKIFDYLVKPDQLIDLIKQNKILAMAIILISNNLIIAIIVFFNLPQSSEIIDQVSQKIENKQETKENTDKNYKNVTKILINMNEVCNVLKEKSASFREALFLEDNSKQDIKSRYDDNNNDIWPVFRWSCTVAQNKSNNVIATGIDLNEYCGYTYSNSKAFYLNYEEQNSWYCVRVPGDYNDEPPTN